MRAAVERGAVTVHMRDESAADARRLDEARVRARATPSLERLRQELGIAEPVDAGDRRARSWTAGAGGGARRRGALGGAAARGRPSAGRAGGDAARARGRRWPATWRRAARGSRARRGEIRRRGGRAARAVRRAACEERLAALRGQPGSTRGGWRRRWRSWPSGSTSARSWCASTPTSATSASSLARAGRRRAQARLRDPGDRPRAQHHRLEGAGRGGRRRWSSTARRSWRRCASRPRISSDDRRGRRRRGMRVDIEVDDGCRSSERQRGILLVISSPSGAGKTTLAHLLAEQRASWSSRSRTRRARRAPGERDGVDYHFVTEDEFSRMVEPQRVRRVGGGARQPLRHGRRTRSTARSRRARTTSSTSTSRAGAQIRRSGRTRACWSSSCRPRWPSSSAACAGAPPTRPRPSSAAWPWRTRSSSTTREYDYLVVNDDLETALKELSSIYVAARCARTAARALGAGAARRRRAHAATGDVTPPCPRHDRASSEICRRRPRLRRRRRHRRSSSAASPSRPSGTPASCAARATRTSSTRSAWRASSPSCGWTSRRSARACCTTASRTPAPRPRTSAACSGPRSSSWSRASPSWARSPGTRARSARPRTSARCCWRWRATSASS